jgi:hypothetical protein
MPPMINFYSEQIDSSTELPGEYWKTANGYLFSRTTSFVHVPIIMLTIAEQSFREAATMHVH